MKRCPSCNKDREDKFFSHQKQMYCDKCVMRNDFAQGKTTLAERRKYQDIYRKYGITKSEYDALLKKQKGCCAICGNKPSRIMIDHCHATNIVRGLLCGKCNTGIGCFDDNPDLFNKAKRYLNKNSP